MIEIKDISKTYISVKRKLRLFQKDFEKIVPEIIDEGEDAVRQKLEMLVRSYDPCISCSAHMLDVQFVK